MSIRASGTSTLWDQIQSWQIGVPDLDDVRALFPLALAGLIVWSLWIYRVVQSRRYEPVVNDFRTTTSVVVPSFHEDVPILMRCLRSWLDQDPTEIIIVLDVADTQAYEEIRGLRDARVRPILFRHAGKRSALGVGIRAARHEVLVLTDSDTSWQPGLLEAVQMPFVDPQVGAVSTQQNVWDRTSNVWRRIADWLVNLRYYDYVPAMARVGAVACVSGRTGAYRRSVVMPVLENLEDEFFLGRRCVAGDDGRLTWLVLASGYSTTHQSTAQALSMFPAGLRAFVKQRIRWSRNSYRCYLTAVYKGWLWQVPFVTKITVLQILLTPVTMGVTLGYLFFSRLQLTGTGIALAVGWLLIGRGIRGFSHLRRHPQEILLLPMVALVVVLVALPIKFYAFVTMNKQGWLTRSADTVGGEGQTSADVHRRAARRAVVPGPPAELATAGTTRMAAVPARSADPLLTAPIPVSGVPAAGANGRRAPSANGARSGSLPLPRRSQPTRAPVAHQRAGRGPGSNGHTTNGHHSNRHTTNGHSTNGHSTNGHSTSRHGTGPDGQHPAGTRHPQPIAAPDPLVPRPRTVGHRHRTDSDAPSTDRGTR